MSFFDSLLNDLIDAYTKFKTSGERPPFIAAMKTSLDQLFDSLRQSQDPDLILTQLKVALKKSQAQASHIYPAVWKVLEESATLDWNHVVKLVTELAEELSPNAFQTLLEVWLKGKVDLNSLIREIARRCLGGSGAIRESLTKLWGPILTAALKWCGPERLADALSDLLLSTEPSLHQRWELNELNLLPKSANNPILHKVLARPEFQLSFGQLLSGLGLEYLIQKAALDDQVSCSDRSAQSAGNLFTSILQTIKEASFQTPGRLDATSVLRVFMELIRQAQADEAVEWELMKMARFAPIGIFLIIAAMLYCAITNPLPWWRLLFNEIEADPNFSVKRLPPPGPDGPKYLIFSDIHRDARSDQREPLEFGSFDHFSCNQQLYCELLDFALENGYTVLEVGDCDELWYYRDFSRGPKQKLEEILDTHQPVYQRLAKLHRLGRYFRLYGNHDAAIRNPEVFAVLKDYFEAIPGSEPFQVYDFAIIEGIKTMDESILNFGLDAEPYRSKAPMLVAHGHQWDFWNCDENHIIGKLIVSAIATPLDFLDDPFIDAGGIAYAGTPVIDFSELLSHALVFSSFPAHLPARKLAHRIQHLEDHERCTDDDVFFLETLAALTGATIAIRKTVDGNEAQRNNLICLGHTHSPKSQPFYNLKKLIPMLRPWLNKLEDEIAQQTRGIIKPDLSLIKSRYFNSGTAGWMEGVIWAIQIDETGQARLVYWTRDTRPERPQTMDWELPTMPAQLREKLEAKKGRLLNTLEELSTYIDPLIDSAVSSIIRSVAAPFEKLLELFGHTAPANVQLDPSDSITGPLCHVLFSMLSAQQPQTHTIRINLPESLRQPLIQAYQSVSSFSELSEEQKIRLACAWVLASQSIPCLLVSRNRFRTQAISRDDQLSSSLSALALVLVLPGESNPALPIQSRVRLEGSKLTIEIDTRPLTLKRGRTILPRVPLSDVICYPFVQLLWKNIVRMPDSII
ncbi:MAG: hypothetical protein ONB33_08790 [candidate division KSB1 bacterium]|nr:hypothetical protein [candidate division KSB1 bacterium]